MLKFRFKSFLHYLKVLIEMVKRLKKNYFGRKKVAAFVIVLGFEPISSVTVVTGVTGVTLHQILDPIVA